MVGVPGFEPGASWSRTKRDTKLRHTPMYLKSIAKERGNVKGSLKFLPHIEDKLGIQ